MDSTFQNERFQLEPDSPQPVPQIEPPSRRRPRWWSFRRPWLPLLLAVVFAATATFVTLRLVQDRRDLESEVASTEKQTKELRDEVEDRAHQIEDLEKRAEDALGSGEVCTQAAEMGVEVLGAFIDGLELASQGKQIEAEKEFVDLTRLGRETDRITQDCISGLRAIREGEAELF